MQSSGGILTFDCDTATIVLTGGVLPTITTDTIIDGGGKITLSVNNASRIFIVNPGARLRLILMLGAFTILWMGTMPHLQQPARIE